MLFKSLSAEALSAVVASPVLIPLVLSSLILLALSIRAAYNVWFHPLRAYPGPKLWAATQLVWVYYRVTGQLVWKSIDLHKKYGSVVRVAPDHLSYTTETAWKFIYGLRAVEMEKNNQAGFSRPGVEGAHAILSADKANHTRLRRILAPALSEKSIKEYDTTIMHYVDLLVEKLTRLCGKDSVDLNKYFEMTTLDLISDVVCSRPEGALEREDGGTWLDILARSIQSQVLTQALETYGLVPWRDYLLPKSKTRAPFQNFQVISSKFEARLAAQEDTRDVLSYMIRDDKAMSPVEMRLNAATIIGAGTGTTATWLSTSIHSLATNPEAYEVLKREIRDTFFSEVDITSDRASKLPYLAAVMQESLRIHCPSPSSAARRVPEGGAVIDGRSVPAGTTVGVHQHAAYHSPENFYSPDHFLPERWLQTARDKSSPFSGDRLDVFHPFSYGPRTCLGIRLTTAETQLILAKLVWHFDIEVLAESQNWQDAQKGTVAWHRTPLKCRLRLVR
ncbi:hypothetical protein AK830_g83 [Neonectria ditissima]|uniref:Isotrichodermin C-15 hydroxylase n=1 Tax=Neonectria ditissima TaxID=78410 RepID=A0A0P7B7U8_9HYPO|nr:hypothetical protein AK830_g83 [Neonectria ditissima]